jgi:GNAT superfamily N-acetyltransferase
VIRSARRDEVDTLLAIQRDAAVTAFGHVFPQDVHPFPSDTIRDVWEGALEDPEIETDIAEVDGEAVGSVSIGGDFLRTLYVLPSHQSRGVGSALHDFALERLRAHGVELVKLWTLEQNWGARRFYERRGWMLTSETRVVPFPPNPLDVQYVRRTS